MTGHRFPIAIHIGGTLAANQQGQISLPDGMVLEHVSAVASNDSDATLQIGTDSDPNGILTATTIGDSGTPAEFTAADFDGALVDGVSPPDVDDDDVFEWLLDYDGSTGTAADDVMLVFTFVE